MSEIPLLSGLDVIICVRLHEKNSWILDRMKLIKLYYDDIPNIYIINYGSTEFFSNLIEKECSKNSFNYVFVEDYGVFSLAQARNVGFKVSKSEFIYFTDIDFFLPKRGFGLLLHVCDVVKLRDGFDFITLPAFHLSQKCSEKFTEGYMDAPHYLESLAYNNVYADFGEDFDFVVPYSNNILISRMSFKISGGYCVNFRGHGSEDFEFLIRLLLISNKIHLPTRFFDDLYGPKKINFLSRRAYKGFRRALELYSFSAESLGLKAFHLWHPKGKDSTGWKENSDRKRKKFRAITSIYKNDYSQLLNIDYLCSHDKILVCFLNRGADWHNFVFLRAEGYSLAACYIDDLPQNECLIDKYPSLAGVAVLDSRIFHNDGFNDYVGELNARGEKIHRMVVPIKHQVLENSSFQLKSYVVSRLGIPTNSFVMVYIWLCQKLKVYLK